VNRHSFTRAIDAHGALAADAAAEAIDAAARAMTDGQPSPALRAAVLARIAIERRSGWWWRLALAGGAVAGLAAAFVAHDTVAVPAIELPVVASIDPTALPLPPSPLQPITLPPRAAHANGAALVYDISDAEREWLARGLPALDGPSAPTIDALDVPALAIAPLTVEPLELVAAGGGGS
jgi:hypothetical protein